MSVHDMCACLNFAGVCLCTGNVHVYLVTKCIFSGQIWPPGLASPPAPPTVVTAPAACDRGHWRQPQPRRGHGGCSPASSRPALAEKGGPGAGRGEAAASNRDPPRSLPGIGHSTILTWQFPGELREFKNRREKPAESIKG